MSASQLLCCYQTKLLLQFNQITQKKFTETEQLPLAQIFLIHKFKQKAKLPAKESIKILCTRFV